MNSETLKNFQRGKSKLFRVTFKNFWWEEWLDLKSEKAFPKKILFKQFIINSLSQNEQ